jgi:hypothetical protein
MMHAQRLAVEFFAMLEYRGHSGPAKGGTTMVSLQEATPGTVRPIITTDLERVQQKQPPPMRCGYGRCGGFVSGHVNQNLCAGCNCPFSAHE